MMNIEEQLNMLKNTTMSTEEKSAIRGAVASYMVKNPAVVRNPEEDRLQYRKTSNNNKMFSSLISFKSMTIAIIIALLLGGGTSFAAENALPGDALYPIKVHVNERVQELAAVSDEAEVKVQAKLATRRLEEAEKLAVQGRLDAQTQNDLDTRFTKHYEKARVSIASDANISAETVADFEVSLAAHAQILANVETGRSQKQLVNLRDNVRESLSVVSNTRENAETRAVSAEANVQVSAEGALKAAENKIAEVRKFFEAKKEQLSANAQAEVRIRLDASTAAVAEGKAKIEAKAYADAFALFKKASREAQSAKLLIVAYQDLDSRDAERPDEDVTTPCPETGCPDESTTSNDEEGGGVSAEVGGSVDISVGSGTVCPSIYAPVCGVNGRTYSSSCDARVAGMNIAHNGACEVEKACPQDARICPDGSAVGRTGPNCEFAACPIPVPSGNECRTDSDCAEGYACIDVSPVVRLGVENLRCWKKDMPTPICLAPSTRISTPNGDVLVKDMKEGMSVWTVDAKGNRVAGTVTRSGSMVAPTGHKVMHIRTQNGHELFVSPGHKVADGREAGAIKAGDMLGGDRVTLAELIPYRDARTYDILASGDTGMYFANGILLQSTLK